MKTDSFYFNNQFIETDSEGYLLDSSQWKEEMVKVLAERSDITMTEGHWEVVRFVRAFYEEYDTSPAIRALVKAMAQKMGKEKGNSRYLHRLFPNGPAKLATKLAGLPKPAKCL
jgi:tRNA 2-thiouridine synthesizing protein E